MPLEPSLPIPGGRIPLLGYGTWRLAGDACRDAVGTALGCGYRHLDTAAAYGNHAAVGAAIAGSGLPRADLFVTTKVPPHRLGRRDLLDAARQALDELGLDYIDLYLVHWPNPSIPIGETLEAMSELVQQGLVRHCGVSNFTAQRLRQAVGTGLVPIATNQVEYHPHLNQRGLQAACADMGVTVTAYCPLGKGTLADDPVLAGIGARYGRSASEVALRWLLQRGIVAIPKAASREHILANLATPTWELAPSDFAAIDTLPAWDRMVPWEQSGPDDRALNG